jgi:5'-deoxynucleotidase YfbR-like HD superfamily hydrolase
MAFMLKEEFPEADMDKVIKMLLIHDLGEAFTGDIPVFNKTAADEEKEEAMLQDWVDSLPEEKAAELTALYREMEERACAHPHRRNVPHWRKAGWFCVDGFRDFGCGWRGRLCAHFPRVQQVG